MPLSARLRNIHPYFLLPALWPRSGQERGLVPNGSGVQVRRMLAHAASNL
jgi:hypothetical protein